MRTPMVVFCVAIALPSVAISEIPEHLVAISESNSRFQWSVALEKSKGQNGLYQVNATEDFSRWYQEDATNQDKQARKEYLDFITTFYSGNLLAKGWNSTSTGLASGITGDARAEVIIYLNVLGRVIASEWAKDNGVRTISTAHLKSWKMDLDQASKRDGDGAKRLAELKSLADEVAAKLH